MAKNRFLTPHFTVFVFTLVLGVCGFNSHAQADKLTQYFDASNENNQSKIDHSQWQLILDDYLIGDHSSGVNRLDYEGIADDSEALNAYIQSLAARDPREFNKREQMAYWINLYNALTVLLVSDNYPVDSITTLGETENAFGPWDDPITTVADKSLTLNNIEHTILRPIWKDHRIHFAVNCASIGCPNIQSEAFTADNLDTLLTDAANEYLSHPRALRFDGDNLILSSIFDWYGGDFGGDQQARLKTLGRYTDKATRDRLKNYSGPISFEYDWGINSE